MTPQELFDARDRGEKIEVDFGNGIWDIWPGNHWNYCWRFRIVPKPKKVIVKYQALCRDLGREFITREIYATEDLASAAWGVQFIRLLTDRPIECEVPE